MLLLPWNPSFAPTLKTVLFSMFSKQCICIFILLAIFCLYLLLFSCSIVSDSLWPHGLQHASLSCTSLSRRLMSLELMMPSNHLVLCHPHLLLHPIFRSISIFFNESALLIRWPKYWSFSFSISPSNEYSGLISFRIDWFDLLAVSLLFLNASLSYATQDL